MTFRRILPIALLAITPLAGRAQDPSRSYYSISTSHFHVTFTRPLEPLARRVAADAERAFVQLAAELHPPRVPIDILVTDDADFSNGSATPFPTNRIIVYATPPVNENGLRFTTDWAQLVVTHELTHIFHLDRSRGLWRLAQYVFGRSPFLFPNLVSPSWFTEGLAVHEESKLAGEGRIEAPEHTMLARTAAIYHAFPSIGQASLALPTFPQGNAAYAYGSLFVDYLAKTRGESAIRNYVERTANTLPLLDYFIDISGKKAFGKSFTSAWKEWQRSVEQSLPASAQPTAGWRELTTDGLAVSSPRWRPDLSLTYTGTGGKESYGAYHVGLDGTRTRISRRNGSSPTVDLPDGSALFAQYELISPYEERSDLFIERGGHQTRLTRDARLFSPDARSDGAIVATQITPGASRLVRVSADGQLIVPITTTSLDTLWSEPRWSNKGDRIVAVRWCRGGVSQIVVIDTLGAVQHVATSGRFTAAAPSWIPGDSGVAYTIGDNARNDVYLQYFIDSTETRPRDSRGGFPGPSYKTSTYKVVRSDFGAFEPQLITAQSPNRTLLAAVSLTGNGYRLGVSERRPDSSPGQHEAPRLDDAPDPRLPPLAIDSSPATKYAALRSLIPRYWFPLFEDGIETNALRIGGFTEGWDLLRRHYFYGEVLIPSDNSGVEAVGQYTYSGFGLPIVTLSASQDWTFLAPVKSADSVPVLLGEVRRRIRDGQILTTFLRQRVRSSATLSVGAGFERREYVSLPDSLLAHIRNAERLAPAGVPRLILSASYATYHSPPFSISPEDGFSVGATARDRLKSGFGAMGGSSLGVVGSASGYKSLDLPGYAHHVLAVRVAGGWADTKTNGYYEVGGTSGGSFAVVPGYTVGEGRQTFPVRGFQPGTLIGVRAMSGSAEYRAPLSLTHRSIGVLPTFLNRSSLTLFGDYGVAWCPSTATDRQVCTATLLEQHLDIGSIGAELNFNAGILSWDAPYRLRLGAALPVLNRQNFGAKQFSVYLTSGVSF